MTKQDEDFNKKQARLNYFIRVCNVALVCVTIGFAISMFKQP